MGRIFGFFDYIPIGAIALLAIVAVLMLICAGAGVAIGYYIKSQKDKK